MCVRYNCILQLFKNEGVSDKLHVEVTFAYLKKFLCPLSYTVVKLSGLPLSSPSQANGLEVYYWHISTKYYREPYWT